MLTDACKIREIALGLHGLCNICMHTVSFVHNVCEPKRSRICHTIRC